MEHLNGLMTLYQIDKILYRSNSEHLQATYIIELTLSQTLTKHWFLRVCSTSLLKTLGEKEKLLVTSNVSFSHSVLYLFADFFTISIKFETVVCKLFHLEES